MDRRIGWSDVSFQLDSQDNTQSWIPGAAIVLREGGTELANEIFFANEDGGKAAQENFKFSTRAMATAKMRELIVTYAVKKWGVAEDRIHEYQFTSGHTFFLL